jgi:hypothetical protein
MKPSIGVRCPHCEEIFREPVDPAGGELACPHCPEGRWGVASSSDVFTTCAICGCEGFFRQKDFNKYLGLLVIVIAAIFVPKTYGLSMVLAFIVDLILYKRTPEMVRCYHCHSEYRRFPIPDHIQLYDHYKAEMFEKERNVNK